MFNEIKAIINLKENFQIQVCQLVSIVNCHRRMAAEENVELGILSSMVLEEMFKNAPVPVQDANAGEKEKNTVTLEEEEGHDDEEIGENEDSHGSILCKKCNVIVEGVDADTIKDEHSKEALPTTVAKGQDSNEWNDWINEASSSDPSPTASTLMTRRWAHHIVADMEAEATDVTFTALSNGYCRAKWLADRTASITVFCLETMKAWTGSIDRKVFGNVAKMLFMTSKRDPYPTGLRKMVKTAFTDDTNTTTTLSIDHKREKLVWKRKNITKEAWRKDLVEIDLSPADEYFQSVQKSFVEHYMDENKKLKLRNKDIEKWKEDMYCNMREAFNTIEKLESEKLRLQNERSETGIDVSRIDQGIENQVVNMIQRIQRMRKRDYYNVNSCDLETTSVQKISFYIQQQIDLLGSKRLYDRVSGNLSVNRLEAEFAEEHFKLYRWRYDFFYRQFGPYMDNNWYTDGGDDAHGFDTVPYQITSNFDEVMVSCCSRQRRTGKRTCQCCKCDRVYFENDEYHSSKSSNLFDKYFVQDALLEGRLEDGMDYTKALQVIATMFPSRPLTLEHLVMKKVLMSDVPSSKLPKAMRKKLELMDREGLFYKREQIEPFVNEEGRKALDEIDRYKVDHVPEEYSGNSDEEN